MRLMTSVVRLALCGAVLGLTACGDGGGGGDAGTDTDSDTDGEPDGGNPWDTRFDAFAAALQADLAAGSALGVSAAVMEDGVVTFAQAFGFKDSVGLEPLTPHTLMQIGSTTKQMTATAVLQKVEAGEFAVDDTLEELLPAFDFAEDPTWDDQITLHNLLTHQSGILDWLQWSDPADDELLADEAYGGLAESGYLMSPPGLFWNYSNANFSLAGLIAQEHDTRMWPDIMAEDVFAPLGMDRTFLRKTDVEADGDYSMSRAGASLIFTIDNIPDPAFGRPAGTSTWTTPTQQIIWAWFIMEGDPEILADALRQEITAAQVSTLYEQGMQSYGYGMVVEPGYRAKDESWYETPALWHDGGTMSFTNMLYMLPEKHFAVAITSSSTNVDFSTSLDVAITTLAGLTASEGGWDNTYDPAEFDKHVGTYYSREWGDIIVTREGDTLLIDVPSLSSLNIVPELEPLWDNVFLMHYAGSSTKDFTFVPEEPGGQSQWIRNRAVVGKRVEEGADGGVDGGE